MARLDRRRIHQTSLRVSFRFFHTKVWCTQHCMGRQSGTGKEVHVPVYGIGKRPHHDAPRRRAHCSCLSLTARARSRAAAASMSDPTIILEVPTPTGPRRVLTVTSKIACKGWRRGSCRYQEASHHVWMGLGGKGHRN